MGVKNDNTMCDVLSVAGSLGLDIDDVRTILPALAGMADKDIEKHLKHGQVMHRLNVSAKLYDIIESPKTLPRDLILAERHLREVHMKGAAAHTGSQELLNLLRETIPATPSAGEVYVEEQDDDGNEETYNQS